MQKLNDTSKIIATKNFREELMKTYDKQLKLKDRYKKKHFDRVACEGRIISLDTNTSKVSDEYLNSLKENIDALEKERQESIRVYNEYSIKQDAIKKANEDIEKFKKEIDLLKNSIKDTESESLVARKLYFDSIKAKMETADKYLKDVKIRFYKIIKATGEIKDDFVLTYKGRDFGTLSRSEKTAVSLEIANMLNKISGIDSPLFIDDSESVPDFNFAEEYKSSQLFIAQVIQGRNLKITNCSEKIKGYTSDVILHKKIKNKEQLVTIA